MDCRIFVEKKKGFDLEAQSLLKEIHEELSLKNVENIRIYNCYDIFGIETHALDVAKNTIFSEPPTDNVYDSIELAQMTYVATEYLPGQFDQRADSAMQCLKILSADNQNVTVHTGRVIEIIGNVSSADVDKIKKFCINPIEMREKDMLAPLHMEQYEKSLAINILTGFTSLDAKALEDFRVTNNLAMSKEDIAMIQDYFANTEHRDPTETEIKVFDTYWSDHCRHTTFETQITNVTFPDTAFGKLARESYDRYIKEREYVHGEKCANKKISLMDMATIMGKSLRKSGNLDDLEVSDEINACSVYVGVDVNGKIEKWLLMFKNETHNHPTEIEPFGGASTCLGGAIRDPLSGRSYVFQSLRLTGAANPLESLEDTLPGKLSQKKIVTSAARGFSSYGNQIGLTTSHVHEIYHEGYKAKRMEVGAVVGAAPAENVRRDTPVAGDVIILLGGKTGRDGCGGATGSSKSHTSESLATCGAEVQKGNAPEERKIQRLFRNKEASLLIKKCNDFGAGGVSVAIGELAPGLIINLDKVPTKYEGLSVTELAISESQERMAVVVEANVADKFIKLAETENIEATIVAKVTDNGRLVMTRNNQTAVDISRDFLDTNGYTQKIEIAINDVDISHWPIKATEIEDSKLESAWYDKMQELGIASEKGLVNMFDSTIGAGTVIMPYGGKYQMTPAEAGCQKLPVLSATTNTVSCISWGFDPYVSSWSPYHGASYAVISSVAKLVAMGVDHHKIRLSFQEYFEKLGTDSHKWGNPAVALLGSIDAQRGLGLPAIGGKDSMSGTFNDIHVPPTLISFAVATSDARHVITPEFKNGGHFIYLVRHTPLDDMTPDYKGLTSNYDTIYNLIKDKKIVSGMSVKAGGIAEALSLMSFGNKIGAKVNCDTNMLFIPSYGDIIVETKEKIENPNFILLGETTSDWNIYVNNVKIDMEKCQKLWLDKLSPVYPIETPCVSETYNIPNQPEKQIYICKHKVAKPNVAIVVFPGTNCEIDSARAFEKEGANPEILLFRNIKQSYIDDSIEKMAKLIDNSQIFVLPGGFSAGDEPDGSGKFIISVLTNDKVAKSIERLLARDGLILGICNGFQALIKSGLLPYGTIGGIVGDSPTLTTNKIQRHISQMVNTQIVSTNSPWLSGFTKGDIFTIPVSHGEGRFYAEPSVIDTLVANGQIATQYVDYDGISTDIFDCTPNGSTLGIEGITSPDGRIFGKMGHCERSNDNLYKNIYGNLDENIFRNGVKYFK